MESGTLKKRTNVGKKDHSDSEHKKPGQPEKDKDQNSDKIDASRKWHHRASQTEVDALEAMLRKQKKDEAKPKNPDSKQDKNENGNEI